MTKTSKCMVYNCQNDAEWRLYTRKGNKTNTRYCHFHLESFAKEEGIFNRNNAMHWQIIIKHNQEAAKGGGAVSQKQEKPSPIHTPPRKSLKRNVHGIVCTFGKRER